MTLDLWERIRELFDEVSRHPPDDRRRVLAELCPDEPDLRAEVLSLIEHDERAEPDFLTPPSLPVQGGGTEEGGLPPWQGGTQGGQPDALIGTRIGKYQINRVIAAGGMGTVYEAEQDHPHRTVAIKVMHAWAQSRMIRRRFEFEVEALARLTHPNIARMYDADTIAGDSPLAGTPYFVMEFVPGARTITDFASERKLETRERLELFLQACDAVHYGHQKGIIHRDLKPANILVSGELPIANCQLPNEGKDGPSPIDNRRSTIGNPLVKVIDFGIARATDSDVAATTMHTDIGQLVGTLHYMSPEQCAGDSQDLDIRTDVYSLGVVLYQLLCGRLPYSMPTSTLTQAIRAICDDPSVRPREIAREIRGNLEFILLTVLQKDRAKRYQSVADLARDIRHYLNREPIEARGPSVIGSIARWTRRHPIVTTAVAAGCVGSAVLAAFLVSLWLAHLRPYRIERRDNSREAVVLSYSGNVLHRWRTQTTQGFGVAEIIEVAGSEPKRLAIIGFPSSYPSELSGKLCAFDVDAGRYDTPIWTSGIEPKDVPFDERERRFSAADFHPVPVFALDDVFPEIPGPEIISAFAHGFSRRVLRILSLRGEVLFQVWHDGNIPSAYWLATEKLLLVAGSNDEVPWIERGGPRTKSANGPWVVWAIRPTLGGCSNKYICTGLREDCVAPAWYKCVLPPESSDDFVDIHIGAPVLASVNPDSYALLQFTYTGFSALRDVPSIGGWFVDPQGNKADLPLYKNTPYLNAQDQITPIEQFHIGQLPPIRSKQQPPSE